MRLGLGTSLVKGASIASLDADAKAYIDAVVAAGATVTSTQRNAINTFVKTGKTDGWYSSLKRLYLPIWGAESPNEIDMIGRTSGTFSGGVTHASGYVQGDGTTGYFDMGASPLDLGLTENGMNLCYIALDKIIANRTAIGSRVNITAHYAIGASFVGDSSASLGDNEGGQGAVFSGVTHIAGIQTASKVGDDLHLAVRRSTGWNVYIQEARSYASGDSSFNFFAMALNNAGSASNITAARFGAWAVGNGLSISTDELFTLALKDLWETATGFTLEGEEYISALKSAGATVTSTQESAIHTFIRTGKTDGWWSSLKRLYLPIWNIEAPNAIDMIGRTSGTFVGTVNRAAGYVSSDGSTGYFLLDQVPASLGLTTSSGSVYCLLTGDAAINGNTWIGGAQDSSNSTRIAIQPGGTNIRNFRLFSAVGLSYSETDSRSILITSRTTTTTVSSYKRTSSGFSTTLNEVSSLVGDVGTVRQMAFMSNNNNGAFTSFSLSTMRFGSYGMGTGMTSSQAENFSAELKTLWETCTGLSLP